MKHVIAGVAASALALALGGCAHQQQAKTEEAPPPVVAQKPEPAPAVAEAPPAPDADLDALLRGTVIHFEYDQDLLSASSRDRLQKLADAMHARPSTSIKISGNCDERGTEEYNIALGQRRAEVARKYLASLGIESSRIDTVSYGKERPADPDHNEKAWAENRRDEFAVAKQ